MAGEPLSYWDYVKAAALRPIRSRALGAMPLTQMPLASFGLVGLFNPGFWLLGIALAVSFVGGRSASARFQKLVEAERLAARREERSESAGDQMLRAYNRPDPMSQARYRALVALCREILGLAGGGTDAGSLTDLRAGNLNQLLWLFLRLLSSRDIDRRHAETGGPPGAQGLAMRAVVWPALAGLGWAAAGIEAAPRAPKRDETTGADLVGITGCFCALAETGTLVLLSGPETHASTHLLPETHIAVVPASRIVATMEDAFELSATRARR